MSTTIAKLAVILGANTAPFVSGMQGATKHVKSFGSSLTGAVGKLGAITGILAGGATIGAFVALVKTQMDVIDNTSKAADRLGMQTEALAGLQHAANLAGADTELLTNSLGKMLNTMATAVAEGGATARAFATLGLSAQQLTTIPADQAFIAIAEAIRQLPNPAERARVAMDIFGKSGQQLLPLMMSGAAGIRQAMQEAEKLGLTFDRVAGMKVEMANDALTRLQGVAIGLGRTLAIELAPYVVAVSENLTNMATSDGGLGPKAVTAAQEICMAIAKMADMLAVVQGAWYGIKATVAGVFWLGVQFSKSVLSGFLAILEFVPGLGDKVTQARAMIDGMQESLGTTFMESFKKQDEYFSTALNGKNSKAIAAAFANVNERAQAATTALQNMPRPTIDTAEAAKQMAENLKQAENNAKQVQTSLDKLYADLQTFGMSDNQKQLFDLKSLGATDEQIRWAAGAMRNLDQLKIAQEKQQEMARKAAQTYEETRTPMERYTERMAELAEQLRSGAIDWETYQRAAAMARDGLPKPEETPQAPANVAQQAKAIMAGSVQAQRIAFEATVGSRSGREDVAKQQLRVAQRQAGALDRIEQNTRQTALVPYA